MQVWIWMDNQQIPMRDNALSEKCTDLQPAMTDLRSSITDEFPNLRITTSTGIDADASKGKTRPGLF